MSTRAVIFSIVIFAAFIVLSAVSKVMSLKIKDGLKVKAWQRFFHLGLTIGVLGMVYTFFAFEGAALLGARFWLLVLFLTALIWGGFIAKYLLINVPKLRKKIEHERNFKRYIP